MKLTTYDYPDRAAWLADRKNFIGASEVASVLNIPGAYGSRWELWMRKLGKLPAVEETEQMLWGQRMESVIAEAVQEEHGGKVARCGDRCVGPLDKPHQRATLDAEWDQGIGGPLLDLELKNVGEYMRDEWLGDAPPAAYYVQCQWQLHCSGLQRAAIAALIGGNRLVLHYVDRNQGEIDAMAEAVDAFWGQVQRQIEPDPTAKDLPNYQYRWQEKRGGSVEVSRDALAHYGHRAAAKQITDRHLDESKLELQRRMGEATEATVNGETVFTWRANKNGNRVFRLSSAGKRIVEQMQSKEGVA